MQTAIVVKWLTQRIVAPSLVGSNPISRPIKQIKPCIKANGVNLRRFRLAPFFLFSLNYEIYAILFLKGHRKNS